MIRRIGLAALVLAALPPASAQAQVAASGTLRTGGVYRASPPSLSDQQLAPLRLDGAGALVVTANIANLPSVQAISASQLPASLGQKSAANSLSVVLSSDQGAVPIQGGNASAVKTDGSATTQPVSGSVSVSNFPATQAVSGTLTANLGTLNGAATDAALTARLGPLGQKTMAGSAPVAIASDQASIPVAASEADGANATLGSKADAASAAVGGTAMSVLRQIRADLVGATPAAQAGSTLTTAAALGVVQQDGYLPGGTAGYTVSTASVMFALDTSGYQSIVLQATSVATQFVVEESNDGSNWTVTQGLYKNSGTISNGYINFAGNFVFPLSQKQIRVRTTGAGAVTIVPVLRAALYTAPIPIQALPAGSNAIGGLAAVSGSGGLTTVSRLVSAAASTNATLVKSSAGRAYKITGYNATAASLRWLKLYNKATAPVPGTDTPFFQLALPPGAFAFDAQDIGYTFGTGIGYAITTGAADTDNTAPAAGDVLNLNVWYQ